MSHKCRSNADGERTVELDVIQAAPKMGQTRAGRWRTVVLATVNLLMIAHLIQWLIVGMTISPVEPSEMMETLEVGVVNAGAIFFIVAILLTAVFGRFFCGWLCHVVALQDACAVFMARIGIRPKAFRSRLLMWVPLLLGWYMFVWPTFKRLVIKPVLEARGMDWPVWLRPVSEIHQLSQELIVRDFWATMPPWEIAVVFLIVCGFVTVYFLGAKGFCTYACPYAGFFKPIDKIAPVRIVVNDDCRQCGHCTSVCSSNVRVNEEVRDFGMVVDSGCMKTLDCVSACPNDALSIGLGGPAILKKAKDTPAAKMAAEKRKRRYDLNLWEDVVAFGIFWLAFYGTRGLFDRVPMLMAGGLAAVVTMLAVQLWWMIKRENVRLHNFQLKKQGKIKIGGLVMGLAAVVMLAGTVWASHAKYARWRGDLIHAGFDVPTSGMMRRDFMGSPEMQAQAREALAWYKRGGSFANGGYGWRLNADYQVKMAYLDAVLNDPGEGLAHLREVIEHGNPTDNLIIQAGQLAELDLGDVAGLLDVYREGLAAHPDLHIIRGELAKAAWSRGNREDAEAMWDYEPEENRVGFLLSRAGYEAFTGNLQAVQATYAEAIELVPTLDENQAGMYIEVARGASRFGLRNVMHDMAIKAIEHEDATALTWLSAGELANALGEIPASVERAEMALSMPGNERSEVLRRAAGILADADQVDRSLDLLERAEERAENDFDRKFIIELMARIGLMLGNDRALAMAFDHYEALAERRSDVPVFMVDYATILFNGGRPSQGVEAMVKAANFDTRNAAIAQKVAEMYSALGDAEKNQEWVDEAERRRVALGDG
ncbi:MAG: 4Fe-4S binding protein [Phycisphaerales bacterium]|nr:4Fe-4S binding protein [Phycisphaerales bacterium]